MHPIRKDFDPKRLQAIDLNVSDLQVTFRFWRERDRTGVLVKVAGVYRPGSAGAGDARFIRWKLQEIFDHPDVSFEGMVVDLTDLEYTWGDELDVDPPSSRLPFLVVLRAEQQEALRYVVEASTMRFHLRTALAEVNDAMRRADR